MSRKPRLDLPGFPMHVVQRGNDRRACFLDDEDRFRYLHRLRICAARANVSIHAYVLMDNHVHLLATPAAASGVSRLLQGLGATYVRAFNDRHARTGTLWEGRFHACFVDSDTHLWNCHRYIELNPVRAGICGRPDDYRWSSFGANALGHFDPILAPHPVYVSLAATPAERVSAYRRFFERELCDEDIRAMRDATQKEGAIGSDAFLRLVEARGGRPCRELAKGRPKLVQGRPGAIKLL